MQVVHPWSLKTTQNIKSEHAFWFMYLDLLSTD